ncbi:MAG: hypothetical protein ACFFDW_11075 [Candidatus Thorarchaeota archaeon]
MALAPITAYVLASGTIMLLIALTFDIILLRQFFKKRTIGTFLLFLTYLFFTFGEMTTISGNYIYTFLPSYEATAAHIQLFYVTLYGLGFVFLYYFANRHILQDSDIIKSITSIGLSFLIGILAAFMTSEITQNNPNPFFYNRAELVGFIIPSGTNMPQYLPSTIIGLLIYVPILLFIQLRMIINIFKILRGLDNRISKFGFTFIFLSVLSLVLGTFASSFFIYDFVTASAILNALFHTLRIIFNTLGFMFGYIGWIMPDWIKNRLRGKAWIVKQMKKEVSTNVSLIASSNVKANNSNQVVEISEQ